jgi:peroxiredoxin
LLDQRWLERKRGKPGRRKGVVSLTQQKESRTESLKREGGSKRSKGWPKARIFGAVFIVLLMLGIYGAWQYTRSENDKVNDTRQKAPSFILADIDGQTVSLENLTEKVVILNFFDTHCPPCMTEISYLKQVHEQNGTNVVIVSIDVFPSLDTVAVLRQFRETNQIGWTIVRDTADIFFQYVSGPPYYTPTTVVIDQEGYMYSTHIGWEVDVNPSKLAAEINYLLGG